MAKLVPQITEGADDGGEGINTWRRSFLVKAAGVSAAATVWLVGVMWMGERKSLAWEVQVAAKNTQIASMLRGINFDPEETKIAFASTFLVLRGRASVYEAMFLSLDDDEKTFALKIFHAGNQWLSTNKRARLLMASLSFMETLNNLRVTIKTRKLDLNKGVDISQRVTTLLKYPGTHSVITPEKIKKLESIRNSALSSLNARWKSQESRIKSQESRIRSQESILKEQNRQLQLLRTLISPVENA